LMINCSAIGWPGRTDIDESGRTVICLLATNPKPVITADEMDKMTPQERADAVDSAMVRSWDDVPEPFRSEVLATARTLGQQRRKSA
jgi:hypothetical protein